MSNKDDDFSDAGDDYSEAGDLSPKAERATLKLFTGDEDEADAPTTRKNERLPWWHFNIDFYSSDRKYSEVKHICETDPHKQIDLRPYMIVHPYVV